MQNKGAIWVFTILLTLACIYQLSFSFFTNSFEKKAKEFAYGQADSIVNTGTVFTASQRDAVIEKYENEYLKRNSNEEVYPLLGHTYQESKEKEMNMGLDLKGGMSVTLEVSIPELVANLSSNSKNPAFIQAIADAKEMQKTSQEEFISLFQKAWESKNADTKLASIFHNRDTKDKFKREATNKEVIDILKEEAKSAIDNTEKILRNRIDKFGVMQPTINKQEFSGRINIELPGVKDPERVRKVLKSTANLEFWNTYESAEIIPILDKVNTRLSEIMYPDFKDKKSTIDSLITSTDSTNNVVDSTLANAESTSKDTSLLSQLEGDSAVKDTTAKDNALSREEQLKKFPLFSKLQPAVFENRYMDGPTVGFAVVADTVSIGEMLRNPGIKEILPNDLKLLWASKPDENRNNILSLYAIKVDTKTGKAPIDGAAITDANQEYDPTGNIEVTMQMNSEGANIWKNMTAEAASQNPKRCIAIVMDDYVYSAPVVQNEIAGGRSSISMGRGNKTSQIEEATDLANLLKGGKFPVPAKIVEESVVGPTLGQEAINNGLISCLLALLLVLLFMGFYYNKAGWIADIAMTVNVFFVLGILASLGAALTLPGIAGIVLTIGMSVDANILIFERVREELHLGKSTKEAIKLGFKHAMSSVIDSHLTALILGIILYIFGAGPIQGFATTLIIGIFSSLFCAIFITRLIFDWLMAKNKDISFSTKFTQNAFKNINIDFVGRRKYYYMFSTAIILIGIVAYIVKGGFSLGVDFKGGRSYIVRFDETKSTEEVKNALDASFGEATEVKTFGESNQQKITTSYLIDETKENTQTEVESKLNEGLSKLGTKYEIMSSQKVGETVSRDIKIKGLWAVLLSCVFMFLFIFIRFKKWQYGLGAVAALFHDVFLVLSVFIIFDGILPFSLDITQDFIAAILTVMSYSMTDTVVVFDRIREYLREKDKTDLSFAERNTVINYALNSTLSRTINTSLTIFFVLLAIFIFGGVTIRGFSFALLIGIVIGTYSSICVATPIVVDFDREAKDKK
jgi:SecD/SecF fusion protein